MLHCIDIMKAIACLLIANFHSDILFPDKLSLLAFGGDVGNNVFFLISGFVLYEGIIRLEWRDLGKWLKKRYLRILPLVLVAEILSVIVLSKDISSPRTFVQVFVFPTLFWFTGAIIVFYPLLFIVEKTKSNILKVIIAIVLFMLHIVFDSLFAERYFIGFIAMIVGSTMRKYIICHEEEVQKKSKKIYLFF